MFRSTVGSRRALSALAVHDLRGCQRPFLGLPKNVPLARVHKRLFSGGTKDERSDKQRAEMLIDLDLAKMCLSNLQILEQGREHADWKSVSDPSPNDIEVIIKNKRTGESLRLLREASDGEEVEANTTQTYRVEVTPVKKDQVGCGATEEMEAWSPVEWNQAFHEACASGDLGMVKTCLKDSPPKALISSVDVKSRRTSLHLAADHGHHEVINLLLQVGKHDPAFIESLDRRGYTPLQAAAVAGNSRCAEALQKAGAKLDVMTAQRRTLLHLAASEGKDEVMTWLIKAGLQLDSRDERQWTPLHCAALGGHTLCLKVAVEGGANWGAVDKRERTALHMAAGAGHSDSVKFLLQVGLEANTVDGDGRTACHHAATEGHQGIAAFLITEAKCDTSATDKSGRTALHWAAGRGHLSVVEWLIDEGVDLNAKGQAGRTPLMEAAFGGSVKILELLAAKGCDIKASDDSGRTALLLAAEAGHTEILEWLWGKGHGNVRVTDAAGRTSISLAGEGNHFEAAQFLMAAAVRSDADYAANSWLPAAQRGDLGMVKSLCLRDDVNKRAVGPDNQTALHLAARNGHLAVVEHLVTAGGFEDLEVQGHLGGTALRWAAWNGHTNVVQYLISKKANLDSVAPGDVNTTPLHIAAWNGHLETVKVLVAAKCDISRRDSIDRTALGLAKMRGHTAVVEYLKSQGCPE